MRIRRALVAIAACVPTVAIATSAQAGPPPPVSSFTVVTSFSGPGPIIEADGVWTGCTEVIDLDGSANQISPSRLVFAGRKEVVCPDGNVVIQYSAEMNFKSAEHSFGQTSGDWQIVLSENAGINGGGGTVQGTSRDCADCIVDTFSGRVY